MNTISFSLSCITFMYTLDFIASVVSRKKKAFSFSLIFKSVFLMLTTAVFIYLLTTILDTPILNAFIGKLLYVLDNHYMLVIASMLLIFI